MMPKLVVRFETESLKSLTRMGAAGSNEGRQESLITRVSVHRFVGASPHAPRPALSRRFAQSHILWKDVNTCRGED